MIEYNSQYQSKIEEFCDLYQLKLDPMNRWIALGHVLPWDKLVAHYCEYFHTTQGSKSINPRIVIGAFIIKHKLGLSDEETLQTISENAYMQFFLGLGSFTPTVLFSPSLFVELRKKLGQNAFDTFSNQLMVLCLPKTSQDAPQNAGKLKIDATIAEQNIRYPNDVSLVNEARLKTEQLIDVLYDADPSLWPVKPRTYRKVAHKRYLQQAKKKKSDEASRRKTLRYLLNCAERNIGYIHTMLDKLGPTYTLVHKHLRILWIVETLANQQRQMYTTKTRRCDHRIVSIAQPHVRPMVRGKKGKDVEFGAKLGLSLNDGFLTQQTLSWEAYNESSDLVKQAQTYKAAHGCFPELIQADKIYATRANREWCKQHNIRLTASELGRPKQKTAQQKRIERKEYAERNHIEGRIGNAKHSTLHKVNAKLKSTSPCWIAATLFVLNLSKFAQHYNFTF